MRANSIKTVLLALVLYSGFTLAKSGGGVYIGNGGDVVVGGNNSNRLTKDPNAHHSIEDMVSWSRWSITVWIKILEDQILSDLKTNDRRFESPNFLIGAKKLVKNGQVYKEMENLLIILDKDMACPSYNRLSHNHGHNDGSILLYGNLDHPYGPQRPVICISEARLREKFKTSSTNQIMTRIEALILHEITHLRHTTETQAKLLQQQYTKDMVSPSYRKLMATYLNESDHHIKTEFSYLVRQNGILTEHKSQ